MAPFPTCPRCARSLPADATECPFDGTQLRVFNPSGQDFPWQESTATGRGTPEQRENWHADTHVRPAPTGPSDDENDRADPLVGTSLGDYVIGERLGRGAMGIVYAGEQPLIGKKVAIKVLRHEVASDENQVNRLLAEARAVNAIRHRGIIDIFNFGKLPDGRHYVVMELLAGEALDAMLHRRGPLTPLEVIGMLDEILSALGAGHGAGIIHRDLKPSNIFVVSESNGSKYLKILDFGLAKQSEAQKGMRALTQANLVVGTPEYMAPEQAKAESVSAQSDLYSVGIIAFELLTGRLPFEASAPFEYMVHQVQTPPPKPSAFIGGIPAELEALVMQLLEKDPGKRPATAEHARRELNRIKRAIASSSTLLADSPHVDPAPRLSTPPRVSTGNAGPRANPGSTGQRPAKEATGPRQGPKTGPRPVAEVVDNAGKTLPADAKVPSIEAPSPGSGEATFTDPQALNGKTEKLAPRGKKKSSLWPALALGAFALCGGIAALVLWKKHSTGDEVQPLASAQLDVAAPRKTPTVDPGAQAQQQQADSQQQQKQTDSQQTVALVQQQEQPVQDQPPGNGNGSDAAAKTGRVALKQSKSNAKESGPTRVALLGDISRMEKRAKAAPQKLTVSPTLARAMLSQLRVQAQSANSPDERRRVSHDVREAEKKLFAH